MIDTPPACPIEDDQVVKRGRGRPPSVKKEMTSQEQLEKLCERMKTRIDNGEKGKDILNEETILNEVHFEGAVCFSLLDSLSSIDDINLSFKKAIEKVSNDDEFVTTLRETVDRDQLRTQCHDLSVKLESCNYRMAQLDNEHKFIVRKVLKRKIKQIVQDGDSD